tara:strand:- start:65 stop:376 length:312 start_codon:yes stop_codon:yes gene_type:complete
MTTKRTMLHIIEVTRTDGPETFVRLSLNEAVKLIDYEQAGSRFVRLTHQILEMPSFIRREIRETITECLYNTPLHLWPEENATDQGQPVDLVTALKDIGGLKE